MLIGSKKVLREMLGIFETANLLGMRLAIRRPRAARSFPGRIYRTYAGLGGKAPWRSVPISEIVPRPQTITIRHIDDAGIFCPIDDLFYLVLIVATEAPNVVFEIGTYRGRTALNCALNTPPNAIVYTLDLPPGEAVNGTEADSRIALQAQPGLDYHGQPGEEKIKQLYCNSMRFDFTPFHRTVDLVFVDGAHDYGAVANDTSNALSMVKPGGVIMWHDFGNYGEYNDVTRAVLERCPDAVQIESSQLAFYRKPSI